MTYQRHWLLSWGGALPGGEIWANNLRFMNRETGANDNIGDAQMDQLLDGFYTDIKAFHTNVGAKINANVQVLWIKFNEIGPNGRYTRTDKTFGRFLTTSSGTQPFFYGAGGQNVPSYQSVCVTTTTGVQRGPGSKGRFFIPMCGPTLTSTGLITSADQTALTNAAAAFLSSLGNEAGIDQTAVAPYVVSNVGEPGPANRITGVRVGSVPDIISRRKNDLVETYTSAVVNTG